MICQRLLTTFPFDRDIKFATLGDYLRWKLGIPCAEMAHFWRVQYPDGRLGEATLRAGALPIGGTIVYDDIRIERLKHSVYDVKRGHRCWKVNGNGSALHAAEQVVATLNALPEQVEFVLF